jgi:site-specific recombinase XerD
MELIITDAKGLKKVILVDDQMKIVKPVLGFLRFQKQKGCEDNSIIAYGRDLKLFWEFIRNYGYSYDQIKPREILEFIEYIRQRDPVNNMSSLYAQSTRSAKTINRILSTVHVFYKYCTTLEVIDNPILMGEINRPYNMFKSLLHHAKRDNKTKKSIFKIKDSERSKRIITDDEAKMILSILPTWRDKLIFKILYFTGARIQEILDIQIEQVPLPDSNNEVGILRNIKSKGKHRDLYMPMDLIEEIDEFILTERSVVSTGHGYVFIVQQASWQGHPLKYRAIYDVFKRALKKSDIAFNFHDARHTFITKLVESGMDISIVRIIAGHANISTTQTYTHLTGLYLEQSMAKYWRKSVMLVGGANDK